MKKTRKPLGSRRLLGSRKLPGMTLIEVLLAVAILAIMIAICTSILAFLLNTNRTQNQIIEDEVNVRLAMLTIAQEIHLIEPNWSDGGRIQAFDKDGDVIGFAPASNAGPHGDTYQLVPSGSGLSLFVKDSASSSGGLKLAHNYQLVGNDLRDYYNPADSSQFRLVASGISDFSVDVSDVVDVSDPTDPSVTKNYLRDIKLSIAGQRTSGTGYHVRLDNVNIRVLRGTY